MHIVFGVLAILAGLAFAVVVFFGNMMSDNPDAVDFSPLWISALLIGAGIACFVWP